MRRLALSLAVIPLAISTPAQDWVQFRGPGATGVAEDDPSLPETWSTTENVAWVADVPGRGWSSPIVVGGLVILTAAISATEEEAPRGGLYFGGERPTPEARHRWVVVAIDWDSGETVWTRQVASRVPPTARHLKNTYASETPVSDGERIFAYFGNVGLYCLDRNGEVQWSRQWEPVATRYGWGSAASPVWHDGRIYILNDNDDQSFLAAIDDTTGEELWRVDRDEGSNWATPYVWQNERRTEIVTAGTDAVRSYDLEGGLLWHLTGMSSIAIPTPFSSGGLLYVTSGYVGDRRRRPVFAIRPGASGDITLGEGRTDGPHIEWFLPLAGPYNPSPLVHRGTYYTLLDRGIFTAHDARTGEEVYGRQRIAAGTGFTASPWAYNDRIFALSEDGDTYVIRAGEEFEILHVNSLDEFSMATPAIARGSLLVRTLTKLYRITETRDR